MTASIRGLHHLTVLAPALDSFRTWAETVLDAHHQTDDDHLDATGSVYAIVMTVPSVDSPVLVTLGTPPAGAQLNLWTGDLDAWRQRADRLLVAHSERMQRMSGDAMDLFHPDGVTVRIYELRKASRMSREESNNSSTGRGCDGEGAKSDVLER